MEGVFHFETLGIWVDRGRAARRKLDQVLIQYINRELPAAVEVSFFVPCLNEAGNIGPTLQNISAAAGKLGFTFEILVFDDNSKDTTRDEVLAFQAQHPQANVQLIANQIGRGLARNYVDGAYLAQGSYYMLVNGDNAEPLETLIAILAERGRADIIIPIFAENDQRTRFRRQLSRTFTVLVNWISGQNIGYFNGPALHRRFNVMRWHADTDGFAYQAEIITRLVQEGSSYKEVVVRNSDRVLGASNALNLKNFLAVSHSLMQIALRRLRFYLFAKDRDQFNRAKIIRGA